LHATTAAKAEFENGRGCILDVDYWILKQAVW
jgi:hypothetical protein